MSNLISPPGERQHYIDALRVLSVLFLIPFHTAMLFNTFDFHIKNSEVERAVGIFINTPIYFWHMPLFMFLAGASTWFAFGRRSSAAYMGERIKRILLPLLVGIAVVIPPQVYIERVFNGDFDGSFLAFYVTFWTTGFYPRGNFTYNHLWFLAFLFVFVILTVPVFSFLKSSRGEWVRNWFTHLLSSPLTIVLIPFITIAAADLWLRPRFPTTRIIFNDWANFVYYLQFFIYGFLIISSQFCLKAIDRVWMVALVVAGGLTALAVYFDWTLRYPDLGGRLRTESIFQGLGVLCTWCWLLGLLGVGRRFMNRPSAFLRYSSEIAYPYYILHQTVILMAAFYILPLEWSWPVKFMVVGLIALLGTTALCEGVKATNVTRFCFGMKPKVRAAPLSQRAKLA